MAGDMKVLIKVDVPYLVFSKYAGRDICNEFGQCNIKLVSNHVVIPLSLKYLDLDEEEWREIADADKYDYITIKKPAKMPKYVLVPIKEIIELYDAIDSIERAGSGVNFRNAIEDTKIETVLDWIERYSVDEPKGEYVTEALLSDILDFYYVDIADALTDIVAEALKKKGITEIRYTDLDDLYEKVVDLVKDDQKAREALELLSGLNAGTDWYLDEDLEDRGIKLVRVDKEEEEEGE